MVVSPIRRRHEPVRGLRGKGERVFAIEERIMRRIKRLALGMVATGIVAVGLLFIARAWADAHYYEGYDASYPLNSAVTSEEVRADYIRIGFAFDSMPGQRVPGLMAKPLTAGEPLPCIIFLHGIGQNKEFLDEIAAPFAKAGYILVTYDQFTRGERRLKDAGALEKAGALKRRAALNIIDTRRLIDYLQTRDDVAHHRIYLVGASFGAITGATAAAFDPRIRAVVLTYGGGDLPLLLASKAAQQELGPFTQPAAYLGAFYMAPADPIHYVGRIAPRPLLLQNGKDDSLIPAESAKALFDAAKEPKELVWYEGDHIGLDEATVRKVLDDALAWIGKHDARIQQESPEGVAVSAEHGHA